jgi:hypothetical protein
MGKTPIFLFVAWIGTTCAGAVDKPALLPDTVGDAVATAAPEQYASNHLYEYIDGGADVYMEAGLKTCTVREYRGLRNKGAEFEIAVFEMGSPLYSFGLFRQLHESRSHAVGTESAAEPLRVSFWKSSLYAEVIDKSSKPVADSALASLAKAVAGRVPGDTHVPGEFRLLPKAGKISGSEQYRKSGFLSRSFLNNVISAEYKGATSACTLFVMTCLSDSDATARLGMIGKEYNGDNPRVRALASRNRVAGCVGCGPGEFDRKWAGILIEQLRGH